MQQTDTLHLSKSELENGLEHILASPNQQGTLEMIVRRPETNVREVIETGALSIKEGLVGDNWLTRGSSKTPDGSAHPEMQLNIMNSRVIELVAQDKSRWSLAGDQLFVDFDLSEANVPAGTRLQIGTAVIEVTPVPHMGCKKFVERFGMPAMQFVNSATGKKHHLRGINAKVVQGGVIKAGDSITKL
jgi:hypothetical protein